MGTTILWILVAMVVLPIISYMMVKFGTAGYFKAKERNKLKNQNRNNTL